MKNMRKVLAMLLAVAMLLSLAACGPKGENTAPQIAGVKDLTVQAESEIDVLAGITATDAEDGDLTSMITVESTPVLTFKNGKATPEKAGNYELTYTVTDKNGQSVSEYATLVVTKKTADAVVYQEFDFDTNHNVDANGWEAHVAEGVAATGELKQGAFVFDITNPGAGDGDIKLALPGFAVKAADYKIKVWAKSTAKTYAHILARDENADGWSTFGGAFNVVIDETVKPLELNFTVSGDGSAELLIHLGKITPNPDNAADTTPENFTVTIDKIEIYEVTGTEVKNPVYTNDFAAGVEGGISVSAGDGASASVAADNGAAKVTIGSYHNGGGVWSIKTDLPLPANGIEAGVKYYFSFKINAANGQTGECLVESATQEWANRVFFGSLNATAGEDVIVSGVFTAEQAIADPVIRLQIGNPGDGVTSNVIVIDDVVFGKLEGDKETNKTIHKFHPFGAGTANGTNPHFPWGTFNGTDEDNEQGVGTIWMENGSLFYRIDQGGVTDWHNKLYCGYGENPLVLKADSYYTVEIVAKASKNVSCSFFLNPLGNWDPRLSEGLDITTEEQTFTFTTTDTLVTDMNFEMLFQFGSEATAALGEVTIEFVSITIYQSVVE
jgi:predicted small lipoprotein YifL